MDDTDPSQQDINNFKESELETLGSLERDLPVELSFLIRQQAYCMARMNYLDRQIRELRETKHLQHTQQTQANSQMPPFISQSYSSPTAAATASHYHQQQNLIYHQQRSQHNQLLQHQQHLMKANSQAARNTTTTHTKNGNGFIPSDDSGGEYSRATISDDDELSSLLDQIAKSVKPANIANADHNRTNTILNQPHNHILLNQPMSSLAPTTTATLQPRATHHYSVINQPQSYAIIQPGQLQHHHQAVPLFVMQQPIATTHPTASISSTVLPGVHFQPEPRYNQYYEDFYVQNNSNSNTILNPHPATTTMSMINTRQQQQQQQRPFTGGLGLRSRQFDSSITAIEQLVSQREKRQIKSQLKSADNWLKMRSSGLSNNLSDFCASEGNSKSASNIDNGGLPTNSASSTEAKAQLSNISPVTTITATNSKAESVEVAASSSAACPTTSTIKTEANKSNGSVIDGNGRIRSR